MKEFFKNRTVLGLGSIILALLLSFGVTPFMNKAMRSQVTIIRASKNIKKGEEITADKITKVKVGGYNLPQQVIKEQNELVGKYATVDIYKDDYFLKSKVSDSVDDDNYLRDENMAISITIRSLAAGLSGKLKAGDIVSIISSSEDGIKPMIIPELQYVEVLSITSKEGKDIEGEKEELPSTINLSVDPIQAEKLVEQEQNGNIHLLLVYRG
ncbi:MAG TPA: Flp pilus assembly protein CpaB, partial [Bacteroidales bacterium]|nr:Flp pilus assembly protein CpaB [Bacteroidales bacterium]